MITKPGPGMRWDIGPGIAGTGRGPGRGMMVRTPLGMRIFNRGIRRPRHPLNYVPFHPFRRTTHGY